MFRKAILALTAVAALGTVSFTSTEASAHGYGFYGKRHVYSYNTYAPACHWQKRFVETYYGTIVRWVKVCY